MSYRKVTNFNNFNTIARYITFVILLILFSSLFFFMKQSKEDRIINLGDYIIQNFRNGLDYEMVNLLSFSLALAEDGELKNALSLDDESKGYHILSNITKRFKKYTHLKSLRIQLLTPDFFIFARSWDEGFEGMPIWWFRDDLSILNEKKEPKVGMETGRLLTFKATIPIHSANKLLGYLEVISLVDEFATKLRQKGIELFALMDEKYLEKAELMGDFPILNKYVIANQNFNQQLLESIESLNWQELKMKKYLYLDDTLYLSEPMFNGKGEKIGIYLLVITDDTLKTYEQNKHGLSFVQQFSDDDIQRVVNSWSNPYDSFRNVHDKELIELLPKLRQEDKLELEADAKLILQDYTKDELIDIVLSSKHKERKIGVIK